VTKYLRANRMGYTCPPSKGQKFIDRLAFVPPPKAQYSEHRMHLRITFGTSRDMLVAGGTGGLSLIE
jgi:hypothetical protein